MRIIRFAYTWEYLTKYIYIDARECLLREYEYR